MGRLRRGMLSLLAGLPFLATGCVGLFAGDELGRRAEQVGDYHRAYDLYVRAASLNPSSRMLSLAIARVAPQAASYWEDQAHRAVDQRRYADAWRMFMQVLEIRPDHPSAPHLIRRLERDHPEEVGPVRLAWLKWGSDVLTSPSLRLADARQSKPTAPSSPTSTGRQYNGTHTRASRRESLALGNGQALSLGMASPGPAVRSPSEPLVTGAPRHPEALATERSQVQARSSVVTSASEPAARKRAGRSVIVSSEGLGGGPARSGLREAAGPTSRRADTHRTPLPATRRATRDDGERFGGSELGAVPGYRRQPSRSYLVIRTLSRKDRRFPKKLEVLDGLTIEVRDTDDDPDADYNVYLVGKQIRKQKNARIGEPHMVVGRSGRVYEIVLLSIIDKRETIRFGIRAAKDRSHQRGRKE